jgi:hypothetical protein
VKEGHQMRDWKATAWGLARGLAKGPLKRGHI